MRIAFGTDERTALADTIVEHLEKGGHDVATVAGGQRWAEVGRAEVLEGTDKEIERLLAKHHDIAASSP